MKKTENYAMPYPEQDDYFNVEDFQNMMVSVDNLMKKLSDSGAQISSDAEHLYNQTKAQMDNIQKRMNTFTSLKDGSTTGDAELTDIRVAYDGKEYGNAGEAVREQASDMHKAIFGAGASIWSKAKSESTKYVVETKGICILNERFTAAGVVAKISRGTFAQNESTLNLDRECSAYIVEFEKNPGTVYMPSAETIKIVSTTKIIFEANGNARCWIPVEKGQYLAVDSTATAYTCESNHVPYMLYDQTNKTLECRGFGSAGSIEPVDPYSLALEYKLEYDMDDTGLVKQIDANREAAASLKEDLDEKQGKIFFHTNRLNPSKVNVDKQLNTNNGELYDATGYTTSDYCDIATLNDTGYLTAAIIYSSRARSAVDRLAFYDKYKNFISSIGSGNNTTEPVAIPQNARYARVSSRNFNANTSYVNVGTCKGFTPYKEIVINDAILNIENDKKVELLKNELIKTVKSGTVITTTTIPATVDGTTNIDYVEFTPKYDGAFAVYYKSNEGFVTSELLVPETYVNSGQVIKAFVNKNLNKYGIAIRTFESEKSVDYSFYSCLGQNFDNVVQELSDTKKLVQNTSDILNNVTSYKVIGGSENNYVGITTSFKIGDSNVFEHGKSYTLNIKDVGDTNHFSRFGLYAYYNDGSGYENIADKSGDFSEGIDFEITIPSNLSYLAGRTWVADTYYSWKATKMNINPECISSFNHPLCGKTLAFYGDSITAQNNGDFLDGNYGDSWAGYFARYVSADSYYARGVGGQTYKWNDTCWYTEVGTNGKYKNRYKYDESGNATNSAINTSTTDEEIALIESALGCEIEVHRGCFCSWDRITTMFPESIKDSIDTLFIMGGTNDFSSVEEVENTGNDGSTKPLFSSLNITDTDWVSSSSYIGGDYDITTTWGAMASTIMKFKVWMPNCKIVILTPIERGGDNYNHKVNNNGATTHDLAEQVMSVARWCDTEAWNMFAECGIDLFNASVMLSDGVHPNLPTGGLRMAKYLASKSVDIQLFK